MTRTAPAWRPAQRTNADADAAPAAIGPGGASGQRRGPAAWTLLSIVAGTLTAATSIGPIHDHDVFLHVAVGEQILRHGHPLLPDAWAYTRPATVWSTSSWAADIALAAVHRIGGDRGVVLLELAGTLALLGGLHVLLRRHRPSSQAIVFCLACLSVYPFLEERPQLASMVFVVWLSWVCDRARRHVGQPPVPVLLTVTWLWALTHGLWVLVPVTLLVVVVARRLDGDRLGAPDQRALILSAALSPVVAMFTPVGPRLLLAPWQVSAAAHGHLAEWLAPRLDRPFAWGFVALLVIVVVGWAVSASRPSRSEVLWVLAVAGYAGLAWRNLGPACILIAPVTARVLDGRSGGRTIRRVPTAAVAALVGTTVMALLVATLTKPTTPLWAPSHIAAALRSEPAPIRVLNDYDIGGYLATSAGPSVRVAVDGRADRYGRTFLSRYFAMTDGRPGWRSTVQDLDPDAAVLPSDAPLVPLLVGVGWRTVLHDNGYVLLAPPASTIWPP
ncbi:MAG: hypothetical protein ABJA34_00090 [Pseudonocardiales bacterium]